MQIHIVDDYEALSELAAAWVAERVARKPDLVLGLATGATPVGMYRRWVEWCAAGKLSLARVRTFNLDEYVGLGPDHPQSYRMFMRQHLFDHVKLAGWRLPDGLAADLEAECRAYEAAIAAAGGIDVQVLGLGTNGHIGFNEPGTPFGSRTHVAVLAERTRRSNARYFSSEGEVPRRAISMGIRTIMNAREIILLASGPSKAEAIAATVEGPVTTEVPSSVLQLHPFVTLVIDRAAAAHLSSNRGY